MGDRYVNIPFEKTCPRAVDWQAENNSTSAERIGSLGTWCRQYLDITRDWNVATSSSFVLWSSDDQSRRWSTTDSGIRTRCRNIEKSYVPNGGCQISLRLSPRRIQYSRVLESAPLAWKFSFFPDASYRCCAASKATARAWGWQRTFVARCSYRTVPCIHTIVGRSRAIESDKFSRHQQLQKSLHRNLSCSCFCSRQ